MENTRVCVTGGSGYLGSKLIKKLLDKGYVVHATLRNLGDESKTKLLKSLPNAEENLKLFKADIYSPDEFEEAVRGCKYVFHLATPFLHEPESKYKDTTEAAVAGVRIIADSCRRSKTVRRLVYTSTILAVSPLMEDGSGYKPQMDESCWTPWDLSFTYGADFTLDYIKSKVSSDKAALSYNEAGADDGSRLEVVSLASGLVGGETVMSAPPGCLRAVLCQLTGIEFDIQALRFIQELLGSVPMVHVDDVCEAHIFCIEKPSLKGRFLCAVESTTMEEIAGFYQRNHPEIHIQEQHKKGPVGRCKCDLSKLRKEGFEYNHRLEQVLEDALKCGKRLGLLS